MSTVTLKWTVPTLYNDGTVLTAAMVDHTDIFDSASDTPLVPVGTVQGTINTFTTGVLTVGVHNFTVETTDINGHESVASNVFSANILPTGTGALPNPVTDLTGTINAGSGPGPVLISAAGPTTGPVAGGTTVKISGTALTGATSVLFGTVAATNVVVSADGTSLTAISPPGAAGVVDITVITPAGRAVLPKSFTYGTGTSGTAPTVVSITPVTGTVMGSTPVTIVGTGFQGATAVLFGTLPATAVVVSPDGTTITAMTPTSPAGVVGIMVVTPLGQGTLPAAFTYA